MVYIIAEAGINHFGKIETARELVIAAKRTGADAVKFQYRIADEMYYEDDSRYKETRGFELKESDYRNLKQLADAEGIDFVLSFFGERSFQMAKALSKIIKLASSEYQLLEKVLRDPDARQKPILMSTGLMTAAIQALQQLPPNVILMHCVSEYPASNPNFDNLMALKQAGHRIGYSDHTIGYTACLAAVHLNISVLEKHFCLDSQRKLKHRDITISLGEKKFTEMVKIVRTLDKTLYPKKYMSKDIFGDKRKKKL